MTSCLPLLPELPALLPTRNRAIGDYPSAGFFLLVEPNTALVASTATTAQGLVVATPDTKCDRFPGWLGQVGAELRRQVVLACGAVRSLGLSVFGVAFRIGELDPALH
jgi:hypothetical protein